MLNLNALNNNKKILVAVSGGKDSMSLLHLLNANKEKLNLEIIAVNVDHNLREHDSKNDSLFVKNYCKKIGVRLYFKSLNVKEFCSIHGYSIEQGARILRYEFFNEVLKENKGYVLATAHHKNDNVETILLNFFRGTGIKGLRGIPSTNTTIRPLLDFTKEEINEYIKENNIPFVEDKTNEDLQYSRNYIRNKLIKDAMIKFPNMLETINRLSKTIIEEDKYLDGLAKKVLIVKKNKVMIPIKTTEVLFKRAIILAFKQLNVMCDYEKIHIDSVYNLVNLENGSRVDLINNLVAYREYDYVTIYNTKPQKTTEEITYSIGGFSFFGQNFILSKTNPKNIFGVLYFDGDKIPENATIRFRKNGDVFKKFGSGEKKLKDYFIDKKVPLRDRDTIPLICDGKNVLLVLGYEISDDIKITENTKNIVYAYYL